MSVFIMNDSVALFETFYSEMEKKKKSEKKGS